MNKTKKLMALLLSVLMLVSVLPIGSFTAMANTEQATVTVDNVSSNPGGKVDVNVRINNNPGILGAVFTLRYDENLTLVNATSGEAFSALAMTKPGRFQSPCQFTWDGIELNNSDIKDGIILTLEFQVSETAENNSQCPIELSYNTGDVVDADLNSVDLSITNGSVKVIDFIYGDANGDMNVNIMDVILIRRFIAGGYDVTINENAANVYCDTRINMTDVIYIRRYIAGGWDVTLPVYPAHTHSLEKTERVEATCTEPGNIAYWYCTTCNKYFSDAACTKEVSLDNTIISANGHTEVAYPYVAPTYSSEGLEGGSYCIACGLVISERTVIPKLEKNQYFIRYNINNEYLENKEIENPNPTTYNSEDGVEALYNIQSEGYVFEGWYDGPGASATKVTSIPTGSSGNKELYAHWTVKEYTIQFDSPLAPVESKTYTIEQGATLTNPEWFGYTFVGWSDEDGNLVERIAPGTTGNITLYANWTSLRNQTIPVQNLSDPIIYEDSENGQYMFAYELGRIENVPLFTIKSFGNTNGITISETTSTSGSISSTSASSIANMIAETTTRSDSWTLSEEWSDSTTISEEHASEVSSSVINSSTSSFANTGKWSISGGTGGTTSRTTEKGISGKVSAKVGTEVTAGANAGPVKAEGKVSAEVGAEVGTTRQDSATNSRNWNVSQGYEGSASSSRSSSSSSSFGTTISDKSGYAQTKAHNKGTSETKTYATSNTSSREYTSSLSYAESTTETTTRTYSNANAPSGYYRLVAAGTVHVFGVVGYDIATRSYYTFTYSIIDDEIQDFVDYSKTTSQFDDYENGVLPFDVPYEVNEYIDDVLYQSAGLVVDIDTGKVVGYNGEATSVYVPEYMPVDNGDGTATVVRITGFESNAFDGVKTTLKTIRFSKYVTEIPDNAFNGYTSLIKITAPSVESIGDDAFNGCTSLTMINMSSVEEIGDRAFQDCSALEEYAVTENVTSIGEQVFNGVNRITVRTANSNVAESAICSGASQIVITNISDASILENKIVIVPEGTEYFEFNGLGKSYNNLRIESNAETTVINAVTIECTNGVPLKLNSENVTLNRSTVDAPEFTMILFSELTTVSLYGTVNLDSAGTNSVLTKNIKLVQANPQAVGRMNVSGNVMICREITNRDMMTVSNGEVVFIDEESYNSLAQGSLEWVLESEIPLGATVVNEKWTYDLTTTITSSNKSETGYEMYNSTWEWGPYGAWSAWQDSPVYGSDSRQVETRTVNLAQQTYLYFYYNSSTNKASLDSFSGAVETGYWVNSSDVYWWNPYSNRNAYTTDTLKAMWNYPMNIGGTRTPTKTQYRYRDRSKVYTYYHKKVETGLESNTEVVNGALDSNRTVDNVKKWVQYVIV